MLRAAAQAARDTHRGAPVNDDAWANRYAVLAGCLPAWADDAHADTHTREHTKEVMNTVSHGQGLATEAATAWREMAAPGEAWLKHRSRERGLMTLVLRCWRERVEHDAAGISHDSTRWRVRREPRQHARQGRRQQRRAPDGSDEKQFQTTQLINLVDFATRFKWSPWRDIQPRATTEEADDSTDMTQLRRWRLKCDLMRVATYYRVTGAQMRVDARKRSARTRTRFREWAASVRRERAAAARPPADRGGGWPARITQATHAGWILLGGSHI